MLIEEKKWTALHSRKVLSCLYTLWHMVYGIMEYGVVMVLVFMKRTTGFMHTHHTIPSVSARRSISLNAGR